VPSSVTSSITDEEVTFVTGFGGTSPLTVVTISPEEGSIEVFVAEQPARAIQVVADTATMKIWEFRIFFLLFSKTLTT
jgi:hypothetical protein